MNTIATTATSRTIDLGNHLQVTFDQRGGTDSSDGRAILLLHGGAGPRSMAGLAGALAEHAPAPIVTPTHPGFDGTPRVPWLDSAADLADVYLDLLEELGYDEVMVIGNSIGGWIAAEMALRDIQGRVKSLVLLNANGIRPDSADQVTDIRGLSPQAIGKLSVYNPALRPNPAALSEEQRAVLAANQQTLALYAGPDFMFAPKLRRRLHRVTVPALVAWGEHDGVVTPDYGRAFAGAFANGHFKLIAEAGHMPQLEQPGAVLAAIGDFADTVLQADAAIEPSSD
jgi:pimeloyl-ACP methyl ester carboxylesterase